MKPVARLAAFAVLLAAVFAVTAVAGGAVDPETDVEENASAMDDGHADTAMASSEEEGGHAEGAEESADGHGTKGGHAAATVKGLGVTDSGYTLELADDELPAREEARLRFRILDSGGEPLERFAVEHERRMHLIVVRRDNTGFQHLHPRMRADGTWVSPIRFDEAGSYRVFADFKTAKKAITLGADLAVDGDASYRALPAPSDVADTGTGYQVRLDGGGARAGEETELRFTVLDASGHTVHTEPYLGAGGHLVALRAGDLAFLHTHPADHGHEGEQAGAEAEHDDSIPFETTFPTAGRYRLYLQFKVDGEIHTAAFTREVTR